MSSGIITVKRERGGRYLQKTEDGWIEMPKPEFSSDFPEGEPVHDPENPPLTQEQLKRMRRRSPAKAIRWNLGLSQQEFADRYQIPVGTLRHWEQNRTEPDATAEAYLKIIAADPEGVATKLSQASTAAAE